MERLQDIEEYWSAQASTFDDEPDHGLRTDDIRAAWAARLEQWIPQEAARVADLGCGTGSLSILLAQRGHDVVGVDLSPAMAAQARAKATREGAVVEFMVGDASDPDLADASFDVVLSRHVVWNLVDPALALSRWAQLLKPTGRLVLVEGRWVDLSPESASTAEMPWIGGVRAVELVSVLGSLFGQVDHYPLSDDARLWGKTVTDERYAVVARRRLELRSDGT